MSIIVWRVLARGDVLNVDEASGRDRSMPQSLRDQRSVVSQMHLIVVNRHAVPRPCGSSMKLCVASSLPVADKSQSCVQGADARGTITA